MKCNSCNKPKADLLVRRSVLSKGIRLMMCKSCVEAKFEPRYIIVLHGHQHGPEAVKEFIKNRRYVGEEILASELL